MTHPNIKWSFVVLCAFGIGLLLGQKVERRSSNEQMKVKLEQVSKRLAVEAANLAVAEVQDELKKAQNETEKWKGEWEKLRQLYNETTTKLQKQINAKNQ